MGRFMIAAVAFALALPSAAGLPAATGTVHVVHGIPGAMVDVYVNGELTLPDFAPKTVTDPLELEEGTYDIALTLPDAPLEEALLNGSATIVPGVDVSLVAHLDADGNLALTPFVNDLSETARYKGRLVFRHAAAAPAVDVSLRRYFWKMLELEGLENGGESQADLLVGSYSARVLLGGTDDVVLGPARLRVAPREATIVYAIGSAADGSLDLLAQNIAIPESRETTGLVTVLHGVPGLVVDVYLNGELALEDFEPDAVTRPIRLAAGDYEIAITAADADIADAVISGSATLEGGANVSVIAHLDADGGPLLSVFPNDVSDLRPGRGRLMVRHTAAAPAVDIRLGRWFRPAGMISGLENGQGVKVDVRAGLYSAQLFPAGSDTAVFGPAFAWILPNRATIVYAVGSLEEGSFKLLAQSVSIRSSLSPFLRWLF